MFLGIHYFPSPIILTIKIEVGDDNLKGRDRQTMLGFPVIKNKAQLLTMFTQG
jgi:hypothetical protein